MKKGRATAQGRLMLATSALLLAATFRLWQIAETPPYLQSDEAFHLLNAQMIARGQDFPVYITGNNGNEPLFAYLSAVIVLIMGPVSWAGRLAAAMVGTIGVAATIRLGDEMFPRKGIGWWAGAALAALYWNIDFSRLGSQPILAATAAAATLAPLWRGARRGSPWAFALAGVSLGLGFDSYLSFRLFGFVVLVAGISWYLAAPERRRSLLLGGVLASLSALVVYSPLIMFFIQYPEWFFVRYSQTTVNTLSSGSAGLLTLKSNAIETINSLFYHGDNNWRHNYPGRPALDAAQGFFGSLGAAVLGYVWRQPVTVSLLAWLVIGFLPSVLTNDAPHFGRTTMVTPALALLIGLGLNAAWSWTRRSRLLRFAILAAGTLSVAVTAQTYFVSWANDPALFIAFSGDQWGVARAFQDAPDGARLLLANPPDYTLEYFLGQATVRRIEVYDAGACVILPTAATEPATMAIVLSPESTLLAVLQQAYPAGTWRVSASVGLRPMVGAFDIPAGLQPMTPVGVARSAEVGGFVRLIGFTLNPTAPRPGEDLRVRLFWQIEQMTQTAQKLFVHVLGAPKADGSTIFAQHDSQPCTDSYPTTTWRVGDWLAQDTTLTLPADMPPGGYILQAGWYDSVTGARAPITADAGPHQENAIQLEQLVIRP